MFYKAVRRVYAVEGIFRKHSLPRSSKTMVRGVDYHFRFLLMVLREVGIFTQSHTVKWLKRTVLLHYSVVLQVCSVAITSPPNSLHRRMNSVSTAD